ncbi:MAG TPA: hypothetical protein VGK19_15000 [Capsulimonadaceae bacterium]
MINLQLFEKGRFTIVRISMVHYRAVWRTFKPFALAIALVAAVCSGHVANADEDTGKDIQLTKPVTGATVRETVPILLPRAATPSSGYVTITIDGQFIKAAALPDDAQGTVYLWDTKAPYTLPEDPDRKLYVLDGDHTITIRVFNRDNSIYGTAIARVRVANTIPELKDGLKLAYKWQNSTDAKYHRTSTLELLNSSAGLPPDTIQKSDVYFKRTVEDTEANGDVLLRDQVLNDGVIINHGTVAYVQIGYTLKGRMRTVSISGATMKNNPPLSAAGSHFGFGIPAFPPRRVQVGDSWQAPIEGSLQWAVEHPTLMRGTARLDAFEWQDGYPCAKIIETYNGVAKFDIDTPQADAADIQGANVNIIRTVWFAYTYGKLVHISTDMKVDANLTSAQVTALGGSSTSPAAAAPDTAGLNPFTPPTGVNSVGNFAPQPGTSVNTGQARAQVSFHVTEEIVLASR